GRRHGAGRADRAPAGYRIRACAPARGRRARGTRARQAVPVGPAIVPLPGRAVRGLMNPVELIGALAGVLTTVAFVPQVVKIWRSGTAEDISLLTFSLYSAGLLLWLLYGIALNSLPLMAANGIT